MLRMYGRFTSSLVNLVSYNVFGADGGSSTMYGTEPWYWYLQNGFVNLGLAWPFVLAAPAVALAAVGRPFTKKKLYKELTSRGPIVLAPALWTAFLSLLPHKEERFLAVVFPLACFTAADCIGQLHKLAVRLLPRRMQPFLLHCLALFAAFAALLGALRCAATISNYGAPLAIWAALAELPKMRGTVVCVGKEWQAPAPPSSSSASTVSHACVRIRYRFHSSFLMPQGSSLAYLQSTFTGQLPQPFATGRFPRFCMRSTVWLCVNLLPPSVPASKSWWHAVSSATRAKQPNFNAVNKEEPRCVCSCPFDLNPPPPPPPGIISWLFAQPLRQRQHVQLHRRLGCAVAGGGALPPAPRLRRRRPPALPARLCHPRPPALAVDAQARCRCGRV